MSILNYIIPCIYNFLQLVTLYNKRSIRKECHSECRKNASMKWGREDSVSVPNAERGQCTRRVFLVLRQDVRNVVQKWSERVPNITGLYKKRKILSYNKTEPYSNSNCEQNHRKYEIRLQSQNKGCCACYG